MYSVTRVFLLVIVSGVTFKAHRLILAACSKHFQELFEGMPPSPAGLIVILDGTSAHNMASLLEFMYRGEVHVSQESLSSFLKAAECLQVRSFLVAIFIFLSHTSSTSLE